MSWIVSRSAKGVMHCVLRVATLAALVSVVACNTAGSPEALELRIVSDRSVLFTRAGDTAEVVAEVVDADGVPLDVEITWESSDPAQVSVDSEGTITARAPLGSATITARYRDLQDTAGAIIVELTPEGVSVDSEDVIETTAERIILRRTAATETIELGDVVINGGRPGFLARVIAVDADSEQIVLGVEPAALTDAIAELDLSMQSDARLNESLLGDGEPDGAGGTAAGGPAVEGSVENLTIPLECKLDERLVNVEVIAFNFGPKMSLLTDVQLRIRNSEVELLELALVGEFGLETGFGEAKVTGGVRGKVECKISLTEVPFAAIPIAGPIAIAATATPNTGVELELDYAAAELTLNGAVVKKSIRIKAGVGYDQSQGYRLIDEVTTLQDELEFLPASKAPDDKFTAKIEPFLGLQFGIATTLGPLPIVSFGVLGTKVLGGYELTMTEPLSPDELRYRGPRWKLYVGATADIDPLIEELALFARFLSIFGLQGADSLLGFSAKLFEWKLPIAESPEPKIALSSNAVSVGEEVTLTYTDLGDTAGSELNGMLWDGSEMRTLHELDTGGSGTEQLVWTPSPNDEGRHNATVRLYDGIFGDIGLPYASDVRPEIEVLCAGLGCEPNPQPPTTNCLARRIPSGALDYVDGATFTETRLRTTVVVDSDTGDRRVIRDSTGTSHWTYDRETLIWTIVSRYQDRARGTSVVDETERRTTAGTLRPECDSDGNLLGAAGTTTERRGSIIDTREWETGGCHPHFGLGQDWYCEYSEHRGYWIVRDANRPF